MKQTKQVRLSMRKELFPYVTKYMDRRIDSYLSLYYECELYDMDDLCKDLTELLYNKQSFSVVASIVPISLRSEPIFKQLTLF